MDLQEQQKLTEFDVNDDLMDPREVIRLKNKVHSMAVDLKMTTHFNFSEVQSLLLIFAKLVPRSAKDSRIGMDQSIFNNVFYKIFGLTQTYFLQRMFRAFDLNEDKVVTMEEWVIGLSVILKGTLDEKTAYAYKVYADGSDVITHDIIAKALRLSIIRTPEGVVVEEFIRDIAFIVLRKLDIDRDSQVSLEDFHQTVKKQPLMLQCLGPCLPSNSAAEAFLATFTPYFPQNNNEF